jgi:hypothetical protein
MILYFEIEYLFKINILKMDYRLKLDKLEFKFNNKTFLLKDLYRHNYDCEELKNKKRDFDKIEQLITSCPGILYGYRSKTLNEVFENCSIDLNHLEFTLALNIYHYLHRNFSREHYHDASHKLYGHVIIDPCIFSLIFECLKHDALFKFNEIIQEVIIEHLQHDKIQYVLTNNKWEYLVFMNLFSLENRKKLSNILELRSDQPIESHDNLLLALISTVGLLQKKVSDLEDALNELKYAPPDSSEYDLAKEHFTGLQS